MTGQDGNIVLCGSNSYEKKYYFNEEFASLPEAVKKQLHVMCVWFTEDIGGILTMEFQPDGSLILKTEADDSDYYYDEVGAGMKLHQMQFEKRELMESLELFFRTVLLHQPLEGLEEPNAQDAAPKAGNGNGAKQ